MREEKGDVRCDMLFGKTMAEAFNDGIQRGAIAQDKKLVSVNNPMPTGDHWRVIGWVTDYLKSGDRSLGRMPPMRRSFIKKAADAMVTGGFCMEISSMAARKFRDDNGLRMQRGKVFIFVSSLPKPSIEEKIVTPSILP